MNTKEWLAQVAYIKPYNICDEDMDCYFSNFDESYITHVGMEDQVEILAKLEITEQLTHGVGYSPLQKEWFGWSHRALNGFKVGSTCVKGDCHYIANNPEDDKQAAIDFWKDEYHINVRCDGIVEEQGEKCYDIKWEYTNTTPNLSLHNTIGGCLHRISDLGRGEWVAKTMEDAKQMAIDFKEGVS